MQTFADSDGDGIGDFAGLTGKVDYLAGLGVTCIWLMPFYPTADLDDGYDITEHYGIDPRLGLVRRLHRVRPHGPRPRHAGDRRPRRQPHVRPAPVVPGGPPQPRVAVPRLLRLARRDPRRRPEGEVFPGDQGGLWTWDPEAGQYYLHRFYRHQPDLNIASAEVRDEIRKLIGFWLAQGLSGFRVDAVPFLLELDGIGEAMELDPHEYLRDLRAFLGRRSGEAVLLGEVNLPAAEQRRFFGDEDGDELHLLFDFLAMQATYLALARGDARPIAHGAASGGRRSRTRRRGRRSCATTTS